MNQTINYIPILLLLIMQFGCVHKGNESSDQASHDISIIEKPTEVTVMELQPKIFSHEIICNGKIVAGRYVDLRFPNSGIPIETINVKNGQRVRKNEVIASLDCFKLEKTKASILNNLERARLEFTDILIGQGYDPKNISIIPEDVIRLAKLRSGINQIDIQLSETEKNLEDATLKAPFDGIVANMNQMPGNWADTSQPLCRIISTDDMDVVFQVLETEVQFLNYEDRMSIIPFSSDCEFTGHISTINPIVDKDGMVKITADISNPNGLLDGMNARVIVKKNIREAIVVPKSAVTLRSGGRKVVFTAVDGKAYWNYVNTSLENMDEYLVTDGLSAGQSIIVSGNENLAHESPITILQDLD